jgi:hypothetical protein
MFARTNSYLRYGKSSKDGSSLLLFAALRIDAKELLSVVLIRDGQLLAAMGATGSQYTTAILGGHSLTEAVLVHAATVVRLECSFHLVLSFVLLLYDACRVRHKSPRPSPGGTGRLRYGLQNYS